jgi:D-alanyl-D-alanine carboxypeptidase
VPNLCLLLLVVLAGVSCAPRPPQSYAEVVAAFAERESFSGVVLVGRADQPLYQSAWGHASRADSSLTAVDTRFQLGSISKWIASLVVLRLVDQGLLDLHQPVATFLPNYAGSGAGRVTLHHLLSHTSGLPNDLIAAFEDDPSLLTSTIGTREAVRRYASGELAFAPGSRFDYAHSNWILVQAVVEQVTGQPYAEVVRRQIAEPAGLEHTGVAQGDFDRHHVALGYRDGAPAPTALPSFLQATGGAYSTAPDLLRLSHAVASGALLSPASRHALHTVYSDDEQYAYGGRVRSARIGQDDEQMTWLSGSNGPSKSRLTRTFDRELVVITLTNSDTDHDATARLTDALLEVAAREVGPGN